MTIERNMSILNELRRSDTDISVIPSGFSLPMVTFSTIISAFQAFICALNKVSNTYCLQTGIKKQKAH